MFCARLTFPRLGLAALLGAFLLVNGSSIQAQDTASASAPGSASDPAFDRFVDLELLSAAWEGKDAEQLTDVALLLAEGERVLLRSHKAITADQVFSAALKVAAERKDKISLARLTKAFTALGKTELAAEAKLASQLADKSRAVDPALNVPADTTSPAVFMLLHDTVQAIKSMKIGQNAKGIEAIVKEIPKMTELSEAQQKALLKLAREAQANLPKDVDPLVSALNKLSDESRKGGKVGGAHPGGSHPGGAHPGGSHQGGKTANRANAPRRFTGFQARWQRQFSSRYNCYLYWDPTYGCYYFFEQTCSCYQMLDDGGDNTGP